jgi:hypothetical protein
MENINTAYNLAQLITGLPVVLGVLPVFYEDCDCGNGLHEVNSLYPDVDRHRNIYLRPSAAHHQATDILAEYNRLNQENEIIRKQVDEACSAGVETHTYSEPPAGWDKCELKTKICGVHKLFDPYNKDHANRIIEHFRNAITDYHSVRGHDDVIIGKYLEVGYPGNRRCLPFNLDHLDILMSVNDMKVTPEKFPHDRYMHLKLHFNVQINFKPNLSDPRWKDMDVKYDHLEVYEFDDTLTLMIDPSSWDRR